MNDICVYERPLHFLSVDELVFYYGGCADLGFYDARRLYHKLLPYYAEEYIGSCSLKELSWKTFHARKSAKKYVRLRSRWIVKIVAYLFDFLRQQQKKHHPNTYETLYQKYKNELEWNNNNENNIDIDIDIGDEVCRVIITKSSTTNPFVDFLFFHPENTI